MVTAVSLWNSPWLAEAGQPRLALVKEDARIEFQRAFGGTLAVLRADAGFSSQEALAKAYEELGYGPLSESKVQAWEAGKRLPDAWEVRRLADLLRCEPNELVFPQELTPRERLLLRRAGRAVRPQHPADGGPS